MHNLIDKNMEKVKESLKDFYDPHFTPKPYKKIEDKFRRVMENNEQVIIEEGGFPHTDSTVMYVTHVTDRWVGGYYHIRHEGNKVKIPKTIHYSDLFMDDKSHKIRVIFEGANPYGK